MKATCVCAGCGYRHVPRSPNRRKRAKVGGLTPSERKVLDVARARNGLASPAEVVKVARAALKNASEQASPLLDAFTRNGR